MNSVLRTLGAAIATAAITVAVGCSPTEALASPNPEAAGIDGAITAQGATTVEVGGPPMRFTVSLVNTGPDIAAVGLVVSLGHCSCGPPGASMMAEGTMRLLDRRTGAWVEAPYVREGTGMDYAYGNLVEPFRLAHGQAVAFELEIRLAAHQSFPVTDGRGSIHVMVTDPEDPLEHPRIGVAHLPFSVDA